MTGKGKLWVWLGRRWETPQGGKGWPHTFLEVQSQGYKCRGYTANPSLVRASTSKGQSPRRGGVSTGSLLGSVNSEGQRKFSGSGKDGSRTNLRKGHRQSQVRGLTCPSSLPGSEAAPRTPGQNGERTGLRKLGPGCHPGASMGHLEPRAYCSPTQSVWGECPPRARRELPSTVHGRESVLGTSPWRELQQGGTPALSTVNNTPQGLLLPFHRAPGSAQS